ncbi:hemolysin family protein [Muribaculum intestinale]|uniref:hemolysin family protein n=1 Tax=Muribaculum intestinale TaxID=1796646 RepID=UPI003528964E
MELGTWIAISLVSLLLSGLFSGTEMAYVTADRVRTELDVKRGGPLSRIINRFYSNSELFISTILVGNNIVLVIYGMGAAALLEPPLRSIFNNEAIVLTCQTLASTAVILLIGEFLPKTVFGINPNSSLKIIALPIYLFYIVLYPISLFTVGLSRLLMRMVGIRNSDKKLRLISIGDLNDYLEETIDDLQDQKEEVENEVKIFRNALDFSQTHVRDCLIPRNEIVAVNIDTVTREELSALFTSSGRSKIIVFRGDIDSVVGYIHVSELFDPSVDWHSRIKPVLYAPENLMANVMMRRLLQQKRSIAVVIDEFGGTAGMLTLEDLVEEIFGNIEDEHDNSRLTARELAEGIYEFSGRCEIADINERFNLDIPESDDYQTLAGYILCSTGTIPAQGDSVVLEPYRFEIIRKSANRLELIRIVHDTEASAEEE